MNTGLIARPSELLSWLDIVTRGNTLSGCVTQDPREGPSEACVVQPTHPVRLVVCTSEAYK